MGTRRSRIPVSTHATRLAAALLALAGGVTGCGGAGGAHGASANRDPVCVLVDGKLAAWRGLPRHTVDDLPECLGQRKDRTSTTYHGIAVDIDYYQPALGVEVWIYGAVVGGNVELIAIRREAPVRVEVAQAELGEPDQVYRWSPADRADAGPAAAFVTRDPELTVDELVYGDQGLALAAAQRADQPRIVFRARGFTPTSADAYLDHLVRVGADAASDAPAPALAPAEGSD
jgi:hypothetical protein